MFPINRYLYCEKSKFIYFEDYVKTFVDKLNLKLITVENLDSVNYNQEDFYFFLAKVPRVVFLDPKIKAIYINMEQLTRDYYRKYYATIKSFNISIVDYSEGNRSLVGNSILLRYQYLPEEVLKLSPSCQKSYDVAFVGTGSPRRDLILNELRRRNIKVREIKDWGEERDQEIIKAKILLNIHYGDDYKIYESIRCDRFIFSGMLVISEISVTQNLLDVNELMIAVEYSRLVSKVEEVVKNYSYYLQNFLSKKEKLLPQILESRKHDLFEIEELLK